MLQFSLIRVRRSGKMSHSLFLKGDSSGTITEDRSRLVTRLCFAADADQNLEVPVSTRKNHVLLPRRHGSELDRQQTTEV